MSSPHLESTSLSRRSLLRALGVGAGVAGFAGLAPPFPPPSLHDRGGLEADIPYFGTTTPR